MGEPDDSFLVKHLCEIILCLYSSVSPIVPKETANSSSGYCIIYIVSPLYFVLFESFNILLITISSNSK